MSNVSSRAGSRAVDLTGRRFGRLVVDCLTNERIHGGRAWACRCDCGGSKLVNTAKLQSGFVESCGCLRGIASTHGLSGTPTHIVWKAMRGRCNNQRSKDWPLYGGRGIRVCERWESFENFLADMGERPARKSIDRINGNGNYEPGNCRWATTAEQSRNTSQNVWISHGGRTMVLADWAHESGIGQALLGKRLRQGLRGAALFAAPRAA